MSINRLSGANKSLALHFSLRRVSGKFLKDRRQGHFGGANRLRRVPFDFAPQQEVAALQDDLDLLEVV